MTERHPNQLDPTTTALVIVDLQEAFRRTIHQFEQIVTRTAIMIQAAKLLEVPILAVEQYPQRLGPTVEEVRSVLPDSISPSPKTAFSACGAAGFVDSLSLAGRRQIVLCGIETHVCVNQTAHDLLAGGYQVHVLLDCTSSRHLSDRETGLARMQRSGVLPCSSEMAIFELLRDATHERFKAVQALIK